MEQRSSISWEDVALITIFLLVLCVLAIGWTEVFIWKGQLWPSILN